MGTASRGNFIVPGELLRKAVGGSAPREETPALPDFQEIFYQPESDERKQLEREQHETRRLADAARNTAKYGVHGAAPALTPRIRWERETDPTQHVGPRLAQREPTVRADVDQARLYAGNLRLDSDDEDDDEDEDEAQKSLRVISPRELLRKGRRVTNRRPRGSIQGNQRRGF